jgi:hypothetical protein
VVFWADINQRTRVTAQALADGMFPGCNIQPGHLADAKAVSADFNPQFQPRQSDRQPSRPTF